MGKEAFLFITDLTLYQMANKNTRIVYTDETNLSIYRSLPDKDFKEFMMAYLTYKKGDDIDSMFTSLMAKIAFLSVVPKIEHNEEKWEKQAMARRENGKKGGRPKKTDITPNEEFDNGTTEETFIQEEQPREEEQVSRELQQDTFQESEEQNEFEIEDFVENNIESVLIPYIEHKGELYYSNVNKLCAKAVEIYPFINRKEIYSIIEETVKRRSSKVS